MQRSGDELSRHPGPCKQKWQPFWQALSIDEEIWLMICLLLLVYFLS